MPRVSNRQQSTRADSNASSSALQQALREKKRIQDRESQRNVRQRTRDYIASLEAQVAELQSPTCMAQLLAANEQLTAKVHELTATIEAISKMIQIQIQSSTGTENTTHATPPAQPSPGRNHGASHTSPNVLASLQNERRGGGGGGEEESFRETLPTPPPQFDGDQRRLSASSRPGAPEPSPPNSSPVMPNDVRQPHDITRNSPLRAWDSGAGQEYDAMVIDSGYNIRNTFSNSNTDAMMDTESDLLGGGAVDSPHMRRDASHTTASQSDDGNNVILSQIGPPTSLWETQIIDSIKLYQSLVAETPDAPIFESENLDIRIFIQTIYTSWKSTPLTRLLVDAIQRWNFDIPERLGIYWLNYLYIKYRASPAKYTSCMPEWFLPCVSQCIASHPIYIDTLPWPALRDKLTFEHETYQFRQFVSPFCNSLNVNWKRGPEDTYDVNPDGSMTLSDAFVAHLRKLENWSLGPRFTSIFPELALCCKK